MVRPQSTPRLGHLPDYHQWLRSRPEQPCISDRGCHTRRDRRCATRLMRGSRPLFLGRFVVAARRGYLQSFTNQRPPCDHGCVPGRSCCPKSWSPGDVRQIHIVPVCRRCDNCPRCSHQWVAGFGPAARYGDTGVLIFPFSMSSGCATTSDRSES
jgi:hypothetical protein